MKKALSLALVICTFVVLLLNTVGLAWLSDNGMSSPINVTGNMHKSYFQSGDGSKEAPFEIAIPIQMYYFSWLQYLGFFNEKDENGKISTVYFIVSEDLDMDGYKLPPVGTLNNPFLGNFDGGGHTISNLTVENTHESLIDLPKDVTSFGGAEIIGFFGVIGSLDGETSYTYDTEANQISNFVLENLTVETQTDGALIGMIAGYVNGLIDRVGVVGSKVTIKSGTTALSYTENVSDYALVGFCTADYKNKLYSLDLYLYDPSTNTYQVIPDSSNGGEGQGWGGSVKMYDIFTWLDDVNDTAQTNDNRNPNYYVSRVDVIGLGENAKPVTNTSLSSTGSKPSYTIDTSDPEHKFGTFVFGYTMNAMQGMDVNFVGGAQKVTEYKYSETNTQVQRYYVRNNNNQYLTFNGSTVGTTSSEGSATKWYKNQQNGNGVFFTVYNNNVYYLNASGSSFSVVAATSVDHDALPSFNGSNDSYVLVQGGQRIKVSNNSYYLDNNGTTIRNESTESNATAWLIENISGGGVTIATYVNGTKYYLSHANNSLTLVDSTSTNTTWQYNNNQFTYVTGSGNRQTTYYLRGRSSGWSVTSTSTNSGLTMSLITVQEVTFSVTNADTAKNVEFTKKEYLDKSLNNRYYDENGEEQITGDGVGVGVTYFPLSSTVSNGAYNPSTGNTGYIIGAGWGAVDSSSTELTKDNEDSNIRISEYANQSGNTTRISNISTPYTMTFNNYTEGAFEQAPQLPTDESELTTDQKERIAKLGFVKYADCYKDLSTSIVNGNCYGLHFMNTAVSAYTTTKIDAYLNGSWIPDYEVPLNCIDFNLYERGFINFLAGSYYTNGDGNDSFFSIYQIFRDGNEIEEIKEIYKIYGKVKKVDQVDQIDTSVDYTYTYVAYEADGKTKYEVDAKGNRVTGGIDGLTMIFDCDWITDPLKYMGNSKSNFNYNAYYFEVPVNAGEYAIGSTKGKTGAYLIYLDLAANAQIVERTRVDEMSVTNVVEQEFPNGVAILEEADQYNTENIKPENSAFVSIGTGNAGGTFTQNGSVITDSGTGHNAVFVGSEIELVDGNGNPMTVPILRKVTVEKSTYYDYNIVTHYSTVTVIKTTTVVENGNETITYTRSVVVKDADGKIVEEWEDDSSAPEITDDETVTHSENEILGMKYIVSDPDTMTVDHNYTVTVNDEGVASNPVYTLVIQNTGENAVPVAIALTEYGVSKNIKFVVVVGETETTLDNDEDEQTITVSAQDTTS